MIFVPAIPPEAHLESGWFIALVILGILMAMAIWKIRDT